jgi:hypothetical protein
MLRRRRHSAEASRRRFDTRDTAALFAAARLARGSQYPGLVNPHRRLESMFARLFAAAVVPALLSLPAVASAEEAPAAAVSKPAERRHSVNVSPLGIAFGAYSVNYEHLFAGGHGLLVEGSYAHDTDDDIGTSSWGGALGYRWHTNGTQDSLFLGVTAAYSQGHGYMIIDDERYEVDLASKGVTVNVGKRWQTAGGLNVTLRIGGGWGEHTVDADTSDPDGQRAEDDVNDFLELFPFAVEGELSIGYSF